MKQEDHPIGGDGGPRWYVVRTHAHRETGAEGQLRRQGLATFLPWLALAWRHGSRFRTSATPLFPGYLFVRFDTALDRWRSINGTIGVVDLLSAGERPQAMPVGVVESLLDQVGCGGAAGCARPGDVVGLTAGSFAGMLARLESEQPEGRVRILIDILGGSVSFAGDGRYLARAA